MNKLLFSASKLLYWFPRKYCIYLNWRMTLLSLHTHRYIYIFFSSSSFHCSTRWCLQYTLLHCPLTLC